MVDGAPVAALLDELLARVADAVVVVQVDVKPPMTVAASASHERLIGRRLVGRPFGGDAPDEVRRFLAATLATTVADGTHHTVGQWYEGGSRRELSTTWMVRELAGRTYVIAYAVDTSAQAGDVALFETLLAAAAAERRRVARDLHDDTVQVLGALTMDLELLRRRNPDLDGALARVRDELQACNSRIRARIADLDPGVHLQGGVIAAVLDRLHQEASASDVSLVCDDELGGEVPAEVGEALYWIALEAARNALRHAGCHVLRLRLDRAGDGVQVLIRDDGVGFESRHGVERGHYGLASMRARARRLGGSLGVAGGPGRGTTVTAWLPLVPGSPAETGDQARDGDVVGALREAAADHQLAWAMNPAALLLCDRSGCVSRTNPAAERLFGRPDAPAIGRRLDEVFATSADPAAPPALDEPSLGEPRHGRRERVSGVLALPGNTRVRYELRRLDEETPPPWPVLVACWPAEPT